MCLLCGRKFTHYCGKMTKGTIFHCVEKRAFLLFFSKDKNKLILLQRIYRTSHKYLRAEATRRFETKAEIFSRSWDFFFTICALRCLNSTFLSTVTASLIILYRQSWRFTLRTLFSRSFDEVSPVLLTKGEFSRLIERLKLILSRLFSSTSSPKVK